MSRFLSSLSPILLLSLLLLSHLSLTSALSLGRLSFRPRSTPARLVERATLPSGWSYQSCLNDDWDRTLSSASMDDGGMTVETCVSFCSAGGFVYAGLEYSNQCYCANALKSGVSTSNNCNSPCAGSSSDICGGTWALSVYKYTDPASTTPEYTALGCFVDGSTRILSDYSTGSASMTTELCVSTCQSKGFAYAGTQFATECWCGSSFDKTKNVAPSSDCNMKCSGSSDTCGAAYREQVYAIGKPSSSPSKDVAGWDYQYCATDGQSRALTGLAFESSTLTFESCLSACSDGGFIYGGIEYGGQCYCGNNLANGQGVQADESSCDSTCSGDQTVTGCGGSWRLALFKKSGSTSTDPYQGWTERGCYDDGWDRALDNQVWLSSALTPEGCIAAAVQGGYTLAGLQYGSECWVGNAIANGHQSVAAGDCNMACAGDSSKTCGAAWRFTIYAAPSVTAVPASGSTTTTTSTTTSATSTSTTSTATTTAATTTTAAGGTQPTQVVPSSGNPKYIWAHHMVGNTYPYTKADWAADIRSATQHGIDGFALNMGSDWWQPARIADAYQAAQELGAGFKMFLSIDMAAISCDGNSLAYLQNLVNTYKNHPAAAKFNGKTILSTFAGQDCAFGQGSVVNGWNAVMGGDRNAFYWMPTFTGAPEGLNALQIDAEVAWNSGWPTGGGDIDTSPDKYYMSLLGPNRYVATVSPGFFTHFAYKNFIWRGDNWLYAERWEQLIAMRQQIDQVEIISWNDYGESHYIGDIDGDMPAESRAWATSSFPHTDILSLQAFYGAAWKNGAYPAITSDKVWVMARPHAASAPACCDSLGPPSGREWTQDNFYAQVHLTAAAQVILSTNAGSQTFQGQPGINRFSYAMANGSGIRVRVVRNGQETVNLSPDGFIFTTSPQQYNYNFIIKSN